MTETNALRVNQALVDSGGNVPAAAAALQITEKRLEEIISSDPAIHARWREKPKAPAPTSIINRSEDAALAEAIAREESRLKDDIKGMGLSSRAESLAIACQKFQRRNYNHVVQITSGGIVKTFLEAVEAVEELNGKIAQADELPDDKRVVLESVWREDRGRLLDYIYKAASKVDQSVLIQAKIQKMFGEANKGGGPEKPGFRPLARAETTPAKPIEVVGE
jgi:hypothetical protein